MYLEFYGLMQEPFRLTPDPRFVHLAEPHRLALSGLVESICSRRGFIVLTGAVGTGKTTLLHTALKSLATMRFGEHQLAVALLVNPTLNRDEFYESVMQEFALACASTSKPARLIAIHELLVQKYRQGGTAVLVIDEAHLMTSALLEEVRLLANYDSYSDALLQVVLCGQPELADLLSRPELAALDQRIALRAELRALTLTEVCGYVEERLRQAGLQEQSPFCAAALQAVHVHSRGVPRVINLICHACLSLGARAGTSTIAPEMVLEAVYSLAPRASTELHRMPPMRSAVPVALTELTSGGSTGK
jgi:general secretion pathway protein A